MNQPSKAQTQPSPPNAGRTAESSIGARTHEVAEQLKGAAQERAERVRRGADSAREHAARRVRKLGVAVKAVGETMRVDEEEFVARYAQDAGRRLDRVADYLTNTETSDLIHDAERYLQQRPVWWIGGAFVAGLAFGRFMKSGGGGTLESARDDNGHDDDGSLTEDRRIGSAT